MSGSGSQRHRWLLRWAHSARRSPIRFWLFHLGVFTLLVWAILILPLVLATFPDEGDDSLVTEAMIVPDDPSLNDLLDATKAERDRIAQLGFVLVPPPHSMPVMLGELPGLSDGVAFARLVQRMRGAGCVDKDNQVNVRPDVDSDTVADLRNRLDALSSGVGGLADLRQNYHKGLLWLCARDAEGRANFPEAARAFALVAAEAEAIGSPAAEQFRFVAIAGQRLALVQTGEARNKALPELPEPPPGLSAERPCTRNGDGASCQLFSWPVVRSDLSRVHEFLASTSADPADFQQAIDRGYGKGTSLTPYNFFSFVAANAKAGDYATVRSQVGTAMSNFAQWQDDYGDVCPDMSRILLLGTIAGRTEGDLPDCDPATSYIDNADMERIAAWDELWNLRAGITEGRLNTAYEVSDDPFVVQARDELFERLYGYLDDRRSALAQKDPDTAQQIEEVLQSSFFPWGLRFFANLNWGMLLLIFPVLYLSFMWPVRRLLIGYSLAFPSRHHDQAAAG